MAIGSVDVKVSFPYEMILTSIFKYFKVRLDNFFKVHTSDELTTGEWAMKLFILAIRARAEPETRSARLG